MKIIASDFDATLYIKGSISNTALEAIRSWQDSGNLFVIVTGRDYPLLIKDLQRFSLHPDYIVTNNGAVLMDGLCNTLYTKILPQQTGIEILKWLKQSEILSLSVYSGNERVKINYPKTADNSLFYHRTISVEEAAGLNNIIQIDLTCADTGHSRALVKELNRLFIAAEAFYNVNDINIVQSGINKAYGVRKIQELYPDAAITAIGDGGNDVCMLEEFQGYTLFHGEDIAKRAAVGIVGNITEFIQKLNQQQQS